MAPLTEVALVSLDSEFDYHRRIEYDQENQHVYPRD